jgi:hypothetical protein
VGARGETWRPKRVKGALWSGTDSNDDLLLAKKVRWVFVTWTFVLICAVTRDFDSQWLTASCIVQHPLTVRTRDEGGTPTISVGGGRGTRTTSLTENPRLVY